MTIQTTIGAPDVVVAQDLRLVRDGHEVLRGVDLTVAPGETIAVLGNGADAEAARALCQVLAGLALPDSGWAHWGGHDLVRLSDAARSVLRRRDVGVVLGQGMLPELPVLENIALPLLLDGASHRRAVGRAADLLDSIGLSGKGARHVAQLGERDRALVALGRALVTAPRLLLVDDPGRGLATKDRDVVHGVLFEHCARTDAAMVLATGEPRVAERCTRRFEMREGRMCRGAEVHYAAEALL